MTFNKIAFAQKILSSKVKPSMIKQALVETLAKKFIGQHGILAPLHILSAAKDTADSVKNGVNTVKANYAGFHPQVQRALSEPIS